MESIEKKVADTILENEEKIVINGITFGYCSPTPGTLIMVSELISQMPEVDKHTKMVLEEVLATAKDMSLIGRIAAVLVLGAKRIREKRKVVLAERKKWSWKNLCFVTIKEEVAEIDFLSNYFLYDMSTSELLTLIGKRLGMQQIADFFALTTSLSEVNLLKRTKEVEVTASGA